MFDDDEDMKKVFDELSKEFVNHPMSEFDEKNISVTKNPDGTISINIDPEYMNSRN